MTRRLINWRNPVQTDCGIRLQVVSPGRVKGLPADEENGRYKGEDCVWRYDAEGLSHTKFLPNIQNVPYGE